MEFTIASIIYYINECLNKLHESLRREVFRNGDVNLATIGHTPTGEGKCHAHKLIISDTKLCASCNMLWCFISCNACTAGILCCM